MHDSKYNTMKPAILCDDLWQPASKSFSEIQLVVDNAVHSNQGNIYFSGDASQLNAYVPSDNAICTTHTAICSERGRLSRSLIVNTCPGFR